MSIDFPNLLNRSFRFISIRPRSEKEVVDYLHKKTLDEKTIQDVLTRLRELDLINDEKFTAWYIDQRTRLRPRSRKLIEIELRQKGIDPMTINDSMTINDLTLAKACLEKKKNLKSREQIIRFLQSRGFSWNTIEDVIKREYNESDVS